MAGAEKQNAFSAAPTESARELDFYEEARESERPVESKIPVGRTRVLFLNRSFWPDREATGQFFTELCDDLAADHRITFIAGPACNPGHPERAAPWSVWRREWRGRVEVVRTWGTRLPKRRLLLRFMNLGSYFALAL